MSNFYPLKITEVKRETPECVSVQFEVPEDLKETFQYQAGQYLTLKTEIEGEEIRRSYSLCSSPVEDEWRVAVKQVEGGKFSTFANQQLKAGDTLESMPPMGNFTTNINKNNNKKYLGFAAGSGITPVISIIKTVLESEPESHFTLFYGNKEFETIIFREEIEALKNRFIGRISVYHILSREMQGVDLFYGRMDKEKCQQFCEKLIDVSTMSEAFICGPEEMIFAIKDGLEAEGMDKNHIHFELFTSPAGKLGQKTETTKREFDPTKESKVTIQLDGNIYDFTLGYGGKNILDAALKNGADLPFACKGGVCCTCRAKLEEGEVDMDVNYALEPEEVEAGFILTCQSHPRTEKIRVNFDEK